MQRRAPRRGRSPQSSHRGGNRSNRSNRGHLTARIRTVSQTASVLGVMVGVGRGVGRGAVVEAGRGVASDNLRLSYRRS